jgi:hypothetical protein
VAEAEYAHFVYAKIWEPIKPLDRGARYEDPLQDALERAGLGEVSGGGSLVDKSGGIQYVGVDIELASLDALAVVKDVLEAAGAPKGSELQFERDGAAVVIPFGVTEGIAIYLDGINLPDDVYASCSTNELAERLRLALVSDSAAEVRGSWQGPEETAIYLYGTDAEHMYSAIESTLLAYPLCQNARVVVRHGNPALGPREIRLPKHAGV